MTKSRYFLKAVVVMARELVVNAGLLCVLYVNVVSYNTLNTITVDCV